jgi:hypothetical protein
MEIVILMCWTLRVSRSNSIFKNITQKVRHNSKMFFKRISVLMLHPAKGVYFPQIERWLGDL